MVGVVKIMKKGKLIFVSGPSGSGKTSIVNTALNEFWSKKYNFKQAISHTSRKPRDGEVDGVDYHFVKEREFRTYIARLEFHEYALVHGNFYGTLKESITKPLEKGESIIKIIDVNGAAEMKIIYPNAKFIFIDAPYDVLKKRLFDRGDDLDDIKKRLERVEYEQSCISMFDAVIVNDIIEEAEQLFLNLLIL
jgi:guanylate kinase